jgi:hypothetical protein
LLIVSFCLGFPLLFFHPFLLPLFFLHPLLPSRKASLIIFVPRPFSLSTRALPPFCRSTARQQAST